MQIFSVITLVLTVIVTFVPFFFIWKVEEEFSFFKKKTVKGTTVLMIKLGILLISSIVFFFTFPTKVMLYPIKIFIVSAIILLTNLILASILEVESIFEKRCHAFNKKFAGIFYTIIFCLLVVLFFTSMLEPTIEMEPIKESKVLEVISIKEDAIQYIDEYQEEQTLLLNESNVKIKVISSNKKAYINEIKITERELREYNKEKIVYKEPYSIFEVYIPAN